MKFQDTTPTSYRKPNRSNKALEEHLDKWTLYKTYNSPNTAYTIAWSIRKKPSQMDKTRLDIRGTHNPHDGKTVRKVWVRAVNAPEQ